MEVEFFLTRGYRFNPDVVVLNYFLNDAVPVPRYDYSFIERVSAAWVYYCSAPRRGAARAAGRTAD